MTRQHVSQLLALWAGNDLDPDRAALVQAHLDGCAACRAEAEAVRRQSAWLRAAAEAPFTPAERLAFRAQVMEQVRRTPLGSTSLWPRPAALAAAAGILLAVGAGLWLRHPPRVPAPAPPAAPPQARLEAPPPRSDPGPRPSGHRPAPRRLASASGPAPVTRMEFQTTDPTLRIIWLARVTPSPR